MTEKISKKRIFSITGAYIAWVIGSGFATGQEVLRFFSSYGYFSYAVAALDMAGFIAIGYILMRTGFEHREQSGFGHFSWFCGERLGKFYTWLATGTLVILIPVLLSGAGATLDEYYGVNKYVGSAIMALLVLGAYLTGFERLIKIVSPVGPVIIAFSLLVGVATVAGDIGSLSDAAADALWADRAAPHWLISALLYLGLTFFPGSTYYTRIGASASSLRELRIGAVLASVVVVLCIAIMSTAILLNADAAGGLDIPVLYFAKRISYALGAVFSITLILGIFSSCSVMMWSVCSRFKRGGRRGNALFAAGLTAAAYVISLFSFGGLVGTFYPIVGYVGLVFLGCVLYKGIKRRGSGAQGE